MSFTAPQEGLYSCARADDGNWTGGRKGKGRLVGTMRGISAPLMVRWMGSEDAVTVALMKSITPEKAAEIAQVFFWKPLQGDRLPAGLDLLTFDFAFNSGLGHAVPVLEQVSGSGSDALDHVDDVTLEMLSAVTVPLLLSCLSVPFIERLQTDLGVTADGKIGPVTLAHARNVRARVLLYAVASRQDAMIRSFRNFRLYGESWLARLDRRLRAALPLTVPENAGNAA